MIDYHVHPDFSRDAQGSIEDYCRRALEVGIEEICFTTHHEPDPAREALESVMVKGRQVATDSDWPLEYFDEIERARRKFPDIMIRSGVEIGYEMGIEGLVSDFLQSYRFDYVLGAVHSLDHIALTASSELDEFRRRFGSESAEFVVGRYFDYVRAAAGSKLFDCIAHLDVYRKYIQPLYGPEFGARARRLMRSVLEDIARSGTGLEVNSSALRRGDSEPYPALDIVKQARALGVPFFTVGSDAHRPDDLGVGLDRVARFLTNLGITPARFEARRRL